MSASDMNVSPSPPVELLDNLKIIIAFSKNIQELENQGILIQDVYVRATKQGEIQCIAKGKGLTKIYRALLVQFSRKYNYDAVKSKELIASTLKSISEHKKHELVHALKELAKDSTLNINIVEDLERIESLSKKCNDLFEYIAESKAKRLYSKVPSKIKNKSLSHPEITTDSSSPQELLTKEKYLLKLEKIKHVRPSSDKETSYQQKLLSKIQKIEELAQMQDVKLQVDPRALDAISNVKQKEKIYLDMRESYLKFIKTLTPDEKSKTAIQAVIDSIKSSRVKADVAIKTLQEEVMSGNLGPEEVKVKLKEHSAFSSQKERYFDLLNNHIAHCIEGMVMQNMVALPLMEDAYESELNAVMTAKAHLINQLYDDKVASLSSEDIEKKFQALMDAIKALNEKLEKGQEKLQNDVVEIVESITGNDPKKVEALSTFTESVSSGGVADILKKVPILGNIISLLSKGKKSKTSHTKDVKQEEMQSKEGSVPNRIAQDSDAKSDKIVSDMGEKPVEDMVLTQPKDEPIITPVIADVLQVKEQADKKIESTENTIVDFRIKYKKRSDDALFNAKVESENAVQKAFDFTLQQIETKLQERKVGDENDKILLDTVRKLTVDPSNYATMLLTLQTRILYVNEQAGKVLIDPDTIIELCDLGHRCFEACAHTSSLLRIQIKNEDLKSAQTVKSRVVSLMREKCPRITAETFSSIEIKDGITYEQLAIRMKMKVSELADQDPEIQKVKTVLDNCIEFAIRSLCVVDQNLEKVIIDSFRKRAPIVLALKGVPTVASMFLSGNDREIFMKVFKEFKLQEHHQSLADIERDLHFFITKALVDTAPDQIEKICKVITQVMVIYNKEEGGGVSGVQKYLASLQG